MGLIQTGRRLIAHKPASAEVAEQPDDWGQTSAERELFLGATSRVYNRLAQSGLSGWLDGAIRFAKINADYLGLKSLDAKLAQHDEDSASGAAKRQLLRTIAIQLDKWRGNGEPSGLCMRLDFLCDLLQLDPACRAVLAVAARCHQFSIWSRLFDNVLDYCSTERPAFLATLADLSVAECRRALSPSGALRSRGIFQSRKTTTDLDLSDFIQAFLDSAACTEAEMFGTLMPSLAPSTLGLGDYAHMTEAVERAERLLSHALQTGQRANLLLYGPPGTGKTELARLLADWLGTAAVSVGEADDDGDEPSRDDRLLHLALSRKLVEGKRSALLVIDEAEDLFVSGIMERGSKLWLNKLVEDGTGPHVWIVNDPGLLGETVVRRMDMAIRFDLPSTSARRTMVERLLDREGAALAIGEDANRQLVSDLAQLGTSPAILSAALRTSSRVGEGMTGAVGLARDLTEASGQQLQAGYANDGAPFDSALSVANCDLGSLAQRLAGANANWTLLLSGPPGTGKSAFARHLAERAGCDLVCRSGAELLGMYVGETEKQIARAFSEAERKKAILLIDEADSFLANRDTAHRNWEVSMTNEMLRQMESGRVRFIATTNRAAMLDPASARRFVLHAEFAEMDAPRARRLFEASFGAHAPSGLDRIAGLTPGDFAQVRQRAALLGESNSACLIDWLAAAVNAREGNRAKVGF